VRIFRNFEEVGEIRNAVVTTGSFDGVHIGHKVILDHLKTHANSIGGETVLITFDPHPRKVLYPESAGKGLCLICSQREKIYLLEKAGLDNLIIVNFTLEFSKITSVEFVRDILLNKLHARKIIIGFNHHFGHNREGDYDALRKLGSVSGFEVEEIPEQDIHNETVSSTKIRASLTEGNIQKANAYLDHFYIVMGPARSSNIMLTEIGFPSYTVTIEEDCKLVPPNGVYAVTVKGGSLPMKGMCYIRKNPDSPVKTLIEVHILDGRENMENHILTLYFHKRIRDEKTISSIEELKTQLELDKNNIAELIY
jgi:riboflavin kinase/FMN adenylyltransferase